MLTISLEPKQKDFMEILLNADAPISMMMLQKQLNMSRRSVYYIVNKVNELFAQLHMEPISNIRGKGYVMSETQKLQLKPFLEQQQDHFLRPKERIFYLICWMMYPTKPIHIEDIIQTLDISRNSVFNDLKGLKHELSHYDLQLEFDLKQGYFITGKALHKRAVLLYSLKMLLHRVHYRSLSFLNVGEVEDFYERLLRISAEMGNEFDNANLLSISCLLGIIHYTHDEFDFSLLELKNLAETKELNLIDTYFQDFHVHERLYLAVHLLGSKAGEALQVEDDENDIRLFELAQRMSDAFERMACLQLVDKNGLINSLYLHFKLSMYYYRLSIQVVNPMIQEVKEHYADIYAMISMICQDMAKAFPFPVMESELVYITMHFGGHLRKGGGKFYRRIKVLVVCPSGISTSTLLRREIEDLYSNVDVVATTSAANLAQFEDEVDFIVSTITLTSEVPWIRVNTILTQEDKSRIASMMMLNYESYTMDRKQVNGLFDVLRKYVEEAQMPQLQRDVVAYLRNGNVLVHVEEEEQLRIFDALKQQTIQILDEPMEWQQAIHKASEPLLHRAIIKKSYVQAMIDILYDYGPCIVLANGVAIAHANPEQGANALGLSLLINKQSITFEDDANVHFLFVLSNPDQDKHLHLLRDIMRLANDTALVDQLLKMDDTLAVLEGLKKLSNMQ